MQHHEYLKFIQQNGNGSELLGRDKFINAAVLAPFVFIDGELHLLFQKRSPHIRQGSEICFPGGLHDPEEDGDYRQTAFRETIEELGISGDKIHMDGRLGVFVSPTGILIECYLGKLDITSLDDLEPNPDEIDELFTLPVSELQSFTVESYSLKAEFHSTFIDDDGNTHVLLPSRELGLPERYYHRWGGNHYRVYAYQTRYGTIWGITGEIVFELLEAIKPS